MRVAERQSIGPISHVHPGEAAAELRAEVRDTIAAAAKAGMFVPRCDAWLAGFSAQFSQELGRRGLIGMTWPQIYGGRERSAVERFVVSEELLVSGAPVAAHWIADRQSGPQIYAFGTESLKRRVLPAIARGECYFALGMSESESGSDLASIRSRAEPIAGGWMLNGTKVWTSHAHRAHFITVLCRTSDHQDRHEGMSVLVVDLQTPGVTVRPIRLLSGEHHFNEVAFEDVEVPDEMMLGREGDGWGLVTSELSLERSGPERFLSTFPLLRELVATLGPDLNESAAAALGALLAELRSLHELSLWVAATIDTGADPRFSAALVKDIGTRFEGRVADVARLLVDSEPSIRSPERFEVLLGEAILSTPGFTLRGGTNEILRSIIARELGVR